MANNLGSLVVSLGLDAAEFTRGMSKSEYQAKQSADRIKGQFDGLMKYVAGLGLGAAFVGAIQSTANYADELGKAAQRAGETSEEFSRLAYAARQADVDNQELAKGLRKLGEDALDGGKGLAELGIQVTGNDGRIKTNAALFRELADVIASTEDPQKRAALAAQALGDKLGPGLVPLLAQGSSGLKDMADEAERFGRVLNDEAVKAAEQFNDNITKLQEVSAGAAATIGNKLIPLVNRLIGEFDTGIKSAGGFWNAISLGTINPFKSAASNISSLRDEIKGLQDDRARYVRAGSDTSAIDQAITTTQIKLNYLAAMERRAQLDDNDRLASQFGKDNPKLASLRARNQVYVPPNSASPKKGPKLRTGAGPKVEMPDPLGDFIKGDKVQGAIARTDELARESARLFEQTRTPLEQLAAAEAELQNLRALGYIQDEEYWRGREAADDRYQAALDKTMEKVKTGADQGAAMAERLGDAFAGTFDRAFREGMKFGDLLKKLAFDAINIQLLTPATQKLGGMLGSAVSSLFSFDGGGYTGSGSRSGGMDGKGGFMAMLHPNETVLDHTKGQGMGGGGTTIVQSFTIDARGADAGVEQRIRAAMEQSKRETLAAVRANVNRGGSWASTMGRA